MSRPAPAMSVVIPAYNAGRFIGAALASLMAQTRRDIEIVVVDDGSTDGTADAVAAAAARGGGAPEIRLIRQANAGVSAARNRGVAEARSQIVGFLDADDLWAPEKAERHLALLDAHPRTLLSFSGFRFVGEDGAFLFESMHPKEGPLSHARLLERNCIHTSTVVARRAAVEAEGGFDPGLRCYEDYDLWLRLSARGPDAVRGIRCALADYRRHSGQTTGDWRGMHRGWLQVTDRQAESHPETWSRVRRRAWGNQLEYCAALAYNSGEIGAMRRLVRRCWMTGGPAMAASYHAWLMTGICVGTYMPRPVQILMGRGLLLARRARCAIAGGGAS